MIISFKASLSGAAREATAATTAKNVKYRHQRTLLQDNNDEATVPYRELTMQQPSSRDIYDLVKSAGMTS